MTPRRYPVRRKANGRPLLSILVVLCGLVLGGYLAIGVLLVGGIEQLIHGLQAHPVNVDQAVWGGVRAFFFELGFLPIWIGFLLAAVVTE